MRSVDLARAAGVSAQQIRNYADAGVLPPVARSATGYRLFEARHRRALLAYRALARGFGLDTAQTVMRAVHSGELPRALELVDAGHAALHEQRRSLRATVEALEALAAREPDGDRAVPSGGVRIAVAARRIGVRPSALRVWESAGLLAPRREPGSGYRSYATGDLRDARVIDLLRRSHYPLPQIRPVLDGLRDAGDVEALRAAIDRRRAALTRQATDMLDGACLLRHYLRDEDAPDAMAE